MCFIYKNFNGICGDVFDHLVYEAPATNDTYISYEPFNPP